MAQPMYTPSTGVGTTVTDGSGVTWYFNGRGWDQISSGSPMSSPAPIPNRFITNSYGGYTPTTNMSPPSQPEEPGYSLTDFFGGKDSDAYRQYKQGQASGRWGDFNDYLAQGGTSEGFANDLVSSIQDRIDEQVDFLEDYRENNPFVFDEELARTSAEEEYNPYYDELLSDYISQVELRRTSIEDDKKLQSEFETYQEGQASRDLMRAIRQANEGFAGKGMFFSGNRARAVGETNVEAQSAGEYRQAQYTHDRSALDIAGQSLDLEEQRKTRDVNRQRQESIEGGILQRENEALTQYNVPFIQSYYRRFDPGNIQGYLVGDLAY